MAPNSQSASQLTRRSINVPSWVWSLVLFAAAALALTAYHAAQPVSAASPQGRMDQAQEAVSHYSAVLAAPRDTSAEDFQRYLDARGIRLSDPAGQNPYKWQRTASSAWDVPEGAALTNYGQTQHMADFVRARPAASAKFGQTGHPEREESGFPGLPGQISEREQQLLDGDIR
jgi:hypothetical protein